MPIIKIEADNPTKEQKQALISELTDTASRILNIKSESFFVLIKENDTDNWGIGGKMLTNILKNK